MPKFLVNRGGASIADDDVSNGLYSKEHDISTALTLNRTAYGASSIILDQEFGGVKVTVYAAAEHRFATFETSETNNELYEALYEEAQQFSQKKYQKLKDNCVTILSALLNKIDQAFTTRSHAFSKPEKKINPNNFDKNILTLRRVFTYQSDAEPESKGDEDETKQNEPFQTTRSSSSINSDEADLHQFMRRYAAKKRRGSFFVREHNPTFLSLILHIHGHHKGFKGLGRINYTGRNSTKVLQNLRWLAVNKVEGLFTLGNDAPDNFKKYFMLFDLYYDHIKQRFSLNQSIEDLIDSDVYQLTYEVYKNNQQLDPMLNPNQEVLDQFFIDQFNSDIEKLTTSYKLFLKKIAEASASSPKSVMTVVL